VPRAVAGLPGLAQTGGAQIPVAADLAGYLAKIATDVVYRRPAPEPIAVVHAASHPGLLSSVVVASGGAAVPIQLGDRSRSGLSHPISDSSLVVLDAGHFVWEEATGEYAHIIAVWITGGLRQCGPKGELSSRGHLQ
jgi:hypothetical protein